MNAGWFWRVLLVILKVHWETSPSFMQLHFPLSPQLQ
jgi:hypothetical protein